MFDDLITVAEAILKLLPGTSSVLNLVPVARETLKLLEQAGVLPGGEALGSTIRDLRTSLNAHFVATDGKLTQAQQPA